MNRPRILELANFLPTLPPHRFTMNHYSALLNPENDQSRAVAVDEISPYTCNTVACLAGWTIYLWGSANDKSKRSCAYIHETAADLLELTPEQADHLFLGGWSPKPRSNITTEEAATHLHRLATTPELPNG